MSHYSEFVPEPVYRYLLGHSLREPAILAQLREETANIPHAQMQVSPEQGQFMALLVRLAGARNCIEVGVFTGYSSLAVALALPDDGRIVACDINEEWTSMGQRYWHQAGVDHKIDLRLGRATRTLDAMLDAGEAGQYDFAFIDADKPAYADYYERVLRLLRTGGLLAVDNTLWSGKLADPDVRDENTVALRVFNDKLHGDERIDLSLLPVGDGLTLARKR